MAKASRLIILLSGAVLLAGCARRCLIFNESTSHEYREYRICRNGTFRYKSWGHLTETISRGSARFEKDRVYINSWNDSTAIIIDSVSHDSSLGSRAQILINGVYDICTPNFGILLNGKKIELGTILYRKILYRNIRLSGELAKPDPSFVAFDSANNVLQFFLYFDLKSDCLTRGITFFSAPVMVKPGDKIYLSFNEHILIRYTLLTDSFKLNHNRLERF